METFTLGQTKIKYKILDTHIEILCIKTRKRHRNKGYASAAMNKMIELSLSLRLPLKLIAVPLDESTDDVTLKRFYRKFGFRIDLTNPYRIEDAMVRYLDC